MPTPSTNAIVSVTSVGSLLASMIATASLPTARLPTPSVVSRSSIVLPPTLDASIGRSIPHRFPLILQPKPPQLLKRVPLAPVPQVLQPQPVQHQQVPLPRLFQHQRVLLPRQRQVLRPHIPRLEWVWFK